MMPPPSLPLPGPIVDCDWLSEHLDHPSLIILDASSHMPNSPRDGHTDWLNERIPGALFFDFNHAICDTESPLPHMLPATDIFSQEVSKLGISNDSLVVIYDSLGIFSSPRGWWMFMAMGHTQCAVLDGGLPAWKAAGGKLAQGELAQTIKPGHFNAQLQPQWIKNSSDILASIDNPAITVLDARAEDRFYGKAPEPRAGLLQGHIPNSKSLPFDQLLSNGKFKPIDELKQIFSQLIDDRQSIYASCGSGVTACIIALAAYIAGAQSIAVYDGSWVEWGDPENELPISN